MVVGRDARQVRRQAEDGAARFARDLAERGLEAPDGSAADLVGAFDIIAGTPDDVAAALAADTVAGEASDVMIQPHPVDPGQDATLLSIELFISEVAPTLGWRPPNWADRRLLAVSS